MNKILVWGSILLGAILVLVALFYFVTPAGHLPTIMPGYIADSDTIHYKHGIGALILGLGLFAFAWFRSAPSYNLAEESENADENTA
jgi:amino acid transporter